MARIRFKPLRSSEKSDDKTTSLSANRSKKTVKLSNSDFHIPLLDHVTQDTWGWEIFGFAVCIATLISIFAVLFNYNQKPLPHVAAGISLNTFISLLATIARSATIFVAASTIAQQKWLRFVPFSRPLIDVDTYDTATRGPLGSLFLLASLRLSFPTAIAAAIVVLALGFEPFVQQSIRFPSRPYRLDGYVPLLQATDTVYFVKDNSSLKKSVIVDSILRQSLYATYVNPTPPDCVTNSCNWSHYTTVAICGSCQDSIRTTSLTSLDNLAFQHFASGDYFATADAFVTLGPNTSYAVSTISTYSISFADGTYLDWDFTVDFAAVTDLALSGGRKRTWAEVKYTEEAVIDLPSGAPRQGSDPLRTLGYVKLRLSDDGLDLSLSSAVICNLTPCAQNLSTYMSNGSLISEVLDQDHGSFEQAVVGSEGSVSRWIAKLGNEIFNSTLISGSEYDSANDILIQLYDSFDNLLGDTKRVLHAGSTIGVGDGGGFIEYGAGLLEANPDTMQFMMDVPNSTAKIAQGFTNYITRGDGNKLIEGEGFTVEIFVDVHWAWLSFPLVLVLICFLVLLVTIYQTRRARIPIWKSSPFPLIFDYTHDELLLASTTTMSTTDNSEHDSELPSASRDEGPKHEEGVATGANIAIARTTTGASKSKPGARKPKAEARWINSLRHHEKLAEQIEIRLIARDKRWSFEKTTDVFE